MPKWKHDCSREDCCRFVCTVGDVDVYVGLGFLIRWMDAEEPEVYTHRTGECKARMDAKGVHDIALTDPRWELARIALIMAGELKAD